MPSTPRRERPARRAVGALILGILTGCGGHNAHGAAPTTTLLQADNWKAPVVSGPPSSQNFCTVLVAMYTHQTEMIMATPRVKAQILNDFTATIPEALANAPADIIGPARTYLTNLSAILNAVVKAGLDYKKVPAGTFTPLLLDPNIKAAGTKVLDYSRTVCHYTIGGAPARP